MPLNLLKENPFVRIRRSSRCIWILVWQVVVTFVIYRYISSRVTSTNDAERYVESLRRDRGYLISTENVEDGEWLSLVNTTTREIPLDGRYGSHLILLLAAAVLTNGPMLEFGAGDYSTPLLHVVSAARDRYLLTADSSATWIAKFSERYHAGSEFHRFSHVQSRAQWNSVGGQYPRWGLVFIDHKPGSRRKIDIARMRNKCDLMVVHDTGANNVENHLNFFKYRYDESVDGYASATSVVSNNRGDLVDLVKHLAQMARKAKFI